MIFLIDDKQKRQEIDYGWGEAELREHGQDLTKIHFYNQIEEVGGSEVVFSEGNIIIFHESFFDNPVNRQVRDSVDIRRRLNRFAEENKGWVVFFSGSKSSRTLNGRIAHLPVATMYKNLKAFIGETKGKSSEDEIDLRVLLFGDHNSGIEERLSGKLGMANKQFDEARINSNKKSLLLLSGGRLDVPVILDNAVEETLTLEGMLDSGSSSEIFHNKVIELLSPEEVDKIFVPLCFGPSLSDYNGLQFACHIRCTKTINQLKPIYVYGLVDHIELLDHGFFDILKSKNVFLIEYAREGFSKAVNNECDPFYWSELPAEISKLKLSVPQNYDDSHGIANEWAIYRWAVALGATDMFIEKINSRVEKGFYFKYLRTIYPPQEINVIDYSQLKIQYSGNPKILYVDDEADKGWSEIMATLIHDINNIREFNYIGDELRGISKDEIIELVVNRVKENDVDIVILDFRLHPADFGELDNSKITGLRLLKAIKDINPGIQVIIFSATNKVWNMQAILDAGADGFVLKEAPNETAIVNLNSTILYFIKSLRNSMDRIFLKNFFDVIKEIKVQLERVESEDESKFDFFLNDLKTQIKIIEGGSRKINLEDTLSTDIIFLNCYNFLEKFKNYYLREISYKYVLGEREWEVNRYIMNRGKIENSGVFMKNDKADSPTWFHVMATLFVEYFEAFKVESKELLTLFSIRNWRNDYIHSNKTSFTPGELLKIVHQCLHIVKFVKE